MTPVTAIHPWFTTPCVVQDLYAWARARHLTDLGPQLFREAVAAKPDLYAPMYFQMKIEGMNDG